LIERSNEREGFQLKQEHERILAMNNWKRRMPQHGAVSTGIRRSVKKVTRIQRNIPGIEFRLSKEYELMTMMNNEKMLSIQFAAISTLNRTLTT
jgi:hypothetical protein